MIAGFTGTQRGMNKSQRKQLKKALFKLDADELHHGCCIGADTEAHKIATKLGMLTCGYPPINTSKMTMDLDLDSCKYPKPYIERNHNIVDSCDILFVAPLTNVEQLRSGTWATYRYAKKINQKIVILKR